MKIIFGLGNPGEKYTYTRHNVGFLFLDYLQTKYNFSEFSEDKKFKSLLSTGTIENEKILLVKPQTFMNISGESILAITSFYKISPQDWLVVYDDISMEFGKIRSRTTGTAGGHNGIKSIISKIGENFLRIKLGIGKDEKYKTSDWVLSKFSTQERKELDICFENIGKETLKHLFK